ncbi:hypothetical protein Srufu_080300 (plasmid) [Streptomyces libani subsp. rufus]|nr:hypothetical protein Srufu_080300 [Streptomyces libani subsp. rufus]
MILSTPPRPRLPQPTVEDVKFEASGAWNTCDAVILLSAFLTPWETETAADGAPMISARVIGEGAEKAMRAFSDGTWHLAAGEQRPQVDYSEPGVVACTWRRGGVWVHLWARDTAPAAPAPTPLVMPAKATVAAPSGRLPYSTALRNRRNQKEN